MSATSVGAIRLLAAGSLFLAASCEIFDPTDPATALQTWDLTNDAGQVATVVVSPFTNSGTFGETGDSDGWWVNIGGCDPIRLPVGGNIVHAGPGDRWSFVGLSGSGCGVQIMGTGEGYANGAFPDATSIDNGTLSTVLQGPIPTSGTGSWTARRR